MQLSVDGAPDCFGKLERLPCLVGFMLWPEYQGSLLEGIVASIGGIDSMLSERCAGALACLLFQPTFMASHVAGPADPKAGAP
jgi:Tubulin folding cofactor D C terminal